MDKKPELFSSKEACAYLGMNRPLFRYHVYVKKNLVPDYKIAHNIAFRQETLDEFRRKHQAEGYTLPEAAAYLGVKVSWLKHHLFNTKFLVPDGKQEKKAIFTKETLDAMKFFLPKQENQ